ncbi:hypothetical protein OS493_034114 [Desmophyllum pertusum]|uniref:Uncharacterized protein n=1 Tax=Desmophyllum pertusum TaxID=174260 RepID=A0A9W9YIT8_9CNID|nr:hypothetical protein OS493_034114 [Desmophyllum pertusum]
MPGTVTEPKSTPWKVTANNGLENTIELRNTTVNGQNAIKPIPSSKRGNKINCKPQELSSQTRNRSQTCSSDVTGKTGSKLDSKKLRCSCQIAMDTTVYIRSENSMEKGTSANRTKVDRSDKTVTRMKTVNVKPWTNDTMKTAKIIETHSNDDGDRRVKKNLTRLFSLLQAECNGRRHDKTAEKKYGHTTCEDDCDGTAQNASQKLLKPGRILYSHRSLPRDGQLDDSYLSGILLVSSKMPSNPWPFQNLPPIEQVLQNSKKQDFPVLERDPKLPVIKPVCDLCTECRQTIQNVYRVHGADMESENLTRLKHSLKLKEREFLEMESHFDKRSHKVKFDNEKASSNELVRDDQSRSKLGGETFTLPKLYLTHHSAIVAGNQQKTRKMRTKMVDSSMATEMCSNASRQRCYKLAKMERLNSTNISSQDKLTKNSAKQPRTQESSSVQHCERSKGLVRQADDNLRVLMTPLRGFTPHCNDLPESPMLWRENTELVKEIEKEEYEEMLKEDLE